MPSPLVVFDLDGTLVDTAPDLVASLNHTIAAADLEPVGYGDLTYLVGHGAKAMIERAFKLRGKPLTEAEFPPMMQRFLAHYGETMPGESRPYPGLEAALDRLSGEGFRLAVCTNKPEALARRLLDGLGLIGRFAAITGGDTFTVRKPDAAHLTGTVERAGGQTGGTLMVGDSLNDFLVARNAGMPVLGVPFGYSDAPIESFEPDHIIHHFDELTPQLARDLIRR